MLFVIAIVSLWGIPALVRTKGEFFWVGIGRHVVERSFGPMEGHGGQTLSSYFLTLPFLFRDRFRQFLPLVDQASRLDQTPLARARRRSIDT